VSVNKYDWHLHVIPEDDANRQLAVGFRAVSKLGERVDIRRPAGGWRKAADVVVSDEFLREMEKYPKRVAVLLIDLDSKPERPAEIMKEIESRPDDVRERIFILGAFSEPERLKPALGSYETIGKALARDCDEGTEATWGHELLRHNAAELARMAPALSSLRASAAA
jgi:hypothetical protein